MEFAKVKNPFWVESYVTLAVARSMQKKDLITDFKVVTEKDIDAERQAPILAEAKRKADEVKRLEAEIKAEEKKATK